MIKIKNIFVTSSLLITTINLVFFIYGMDKISHLSEIAKEDCLKYFKYNVGVICLFAFSLVVSFSYLCCGTLTSTILYILNSIGLTSMAIHRYIKKENLCDYECEMKCTDLVNLGNNVEIFFITDLSIICLTVVTLATVAAMKMFECCGYDDY
jgi:hypothetical protein